MDQVRAAEEISTGELLDGRYRLDARIGEGGMARVYRAEDTVLKRTVAIKILRTPVDGLASLERARSETTLLAGLNHHSLVTLFDAHIGTDDDAYLVMEYVEGITLLDRISKGPLSSDEAASLTVDLAEALHVAHAAGIVHRDIKPSNVLLWRSPLPGREWRAKLADFGIAHLLDSQRVTTPGLVVGTVAYIAPEQARGATPAPSADIYALGILLIEALSGKRPFADAEGFGAVMARLANAPEVPDSVGESWQQLLRWMTDMRAEDRPTALEVAVAASKIATAPVPVASIDQQTVAAAVMPVAAGATAPTMLAPAAPATGTTALLPASPEVPHASGVPSGRDRARRRGIVTAIVLGVLLIGAATFGLLWPSLAPSAVPEPVPSQQIEEPVEEPVVEEPAVEEPVPADTGTEDSGNDNSGPGNNNGNGNGGDKGKGGKGGKG